MELVPKYEIGNLLQDRGTNLVGNGDEIVIINDFREGLFGKKQTIIYKVYYLSKNMTESFSEYILNEYFTKI